METQKIAAPEAPEAEYRKYTARDTRRWYNLLIDLGIDEFLQAIIDRPKFKPGQSVTAKEQAQGYADDRDDFAPIEIKIDFPRLFRKLAKEGAFYEFVSIVMGVPVSDAENVDMVSFAGQAPFFVYISLSPIKQLFGISGFMVETTEEAAEATEI